MKFYAPSMCAFFIFLLILIPFSLFSQKMPLQFVSGDTQFGITGKYRPDLFIGKNINLANSDNNEDRTFYARHTFDILFDYIYGKETFKYDVLKFRWDLRNKATWGVAANVPTTSTSIKDEAGVLTGNHTHFIARHLLWIRQLWLQGSLPDVLGIKTDYMHTFTLGAFPFVLGRGISLGDAYAVDTALLGFDPETAVDQYAYGLKLSGQLMAKNVLTYDLYGAFLDNKASTFKDTTAPVYAQRYDFRTTPQRGPGHIRYVAAGRLMWKPLWEKEKKVTLEPYALYSNTPEQKIEFIADSESKLGTVGLAGDFIIGKLEFGFDTAFNLGRQKVYGWDRNIPKLEIRDGVAYAVNSSVLDSLGKSAILSKNNNFVAATALEDERFNDKLIGESGLKNSATRFSNPYINKFTGSMAVLDATYWICNQVFGISAAVGYASGDQSPNFDVTLDQQTLLENDYQGFIPLQEVYNGTRVESSFFMAGSGRLPRLVSQPDSDVPFTQIDSISGFTNLRYVGLGLEYSPQNSPRKVNIQPNILGFWLDVPTRIPRLKGQDPRPEKNAGTYLGLEINTLADALLLPDLKAFGKIAVFFPGTFYTDYKNSPVNSAQRKYFENKIALEAFQKEGKKDPQVLLVREPLLGDNPCLAINVGLEYRF
jgi:hypothetical protein